jgi:hypothetical protein
MRVRRQGSVVILGWRLFSGADALGCSTEEEDSATERYCAAVCARGSQCGNANVGCIRVCKESADSSKTASSIVVVSIAASSDALTRLEARLRAKIPHLESHRSGERLRVAASTNSSLDLLWAVDGDL